MINAEDWISGQNWIGQYFDEMSRLRGRCAYPHSNEMQDSILSCAFVFAFSYLGYDLWDERRMHLYNANDYTLQR